MSTRLRSSRRSSASRNATGLTTDGTIGAATIGVMNVSLADAREADRAGDGAHALVADLERGTQRLRQPAVVPDVGDRPHHRRRAAADERRGRQVAGPSDADLRREDGIRHLPSLLDAAAWHYREGNRAAHPARPGVLRQGKPGDRRERRGRRADVRADAGESLAGRGRTAAHPSAARSQELARVGQVHLPECRQRLHARHAGAAALLARPPRLQSRLHPAGRSGAVRGMGAAGPAGMDAASGSMPRCRAPGRCAST